MAGKGYSSILKLAVGANKELNHPQEHEVLDLALFLKLLIYFVLIAEFLFLGFDLVVELSSLLHSELRIPVSLVVTLGWRQVIRRLSSSLSR